MAAWKVGLLGFVCGGLLVGVVRWHVAAGVVEPPAKRGVLSSEMDRRLERVEFNDEPFAAALRQLGKQASCAIIARWPILFSEGVDEYAPINVNLRDVPLSVALRVVLEQAGRSTAKLDFKASRGAILVSTRRELRNEEAVLRVYDVTDLTNAQVARNRILRRGAAAAQASVPSTQPAAPEPSPAEDAEFAQNQVQQTLFDSSHTDEDAITDPSSRSWYNCWEGRMLVLENPEIQARIVALLAEMRRAIPASR